MASTRSLVSLVAYAVLAAAVLQASETRVRAATSSPSSPFTGGDPSQPSLPSSPPLPGSPAFPPSPGFPGMAGAQSSPSPSQQPARTCMEPLMLVEPCASYLTNSSVRAPPRACCDGLRSLVGGGDRICLCHAIMGDLGIFAGGTIDQLRMLVLPLTCSTFVPPDLLLMCLVNPVPPILPD